MFWKDTYLLGVGLIDEQHRELFNRVEAFLKILRAPVAWEDRVGGVNETLDFMKSYVVTHFHEEEAYQRKIGYPGYEKHKAIHEGMVAYVVQVSQEYETAGFDEKSIQQFGGKLLAWLINHVAAEDQQISRFAKEKGVAADV